MSRSLARERLCRDARVLGAFLDGELDAASLLEMEEHLGACELCRERVALDKATRGSLQRVVRVPSADPALVGLRARAAAAMSAERARSDARTLEGHDRSRLLGWRTMVPIASAAALALFWGAAAKGPISDTGGQRMQSDFGGDLLAELIAEHSRPVPPQWTDPKEVRALDQYVGVPVHPGNFERGGARLIGGRVLPVTGMAHEERAAMLQYVIGNGAGTRRLSVFIYDPSKIQISGPGLAPRAVGTAEVRYGRSNGYSVALTQRNGVGYALASDLDQERSLQLAALADDNAGDE